MGKRFPHSPDIVKYIRRESNQIKKQLSLIKSKIVSQIKLKTTNIKNADANDKAHGGKSDGRARNAAV